MTLLNNRYHIQKTLGQGGMGCVYLAIDKHSQSFVAVKECFVGKNQNIIERIKREYYFMSKISHPNLIRAYDIFCLRKRYFIVMEYIRGITLTDIIRNKNFNLNIQQKIHITQQLCHAVAFLNNNGIVHRDLKPSNIIVQENGTPKILDFGIAKCINRELETLTNTDAVIGTPEYMSPEQFSGDVQPNTDVFSLAVVLYQFFADMPSSPFYGETMVSTMFKVVNEQLPPLHDVVKNNSPEYMFISNILQHALIKDYRGRTGSMQEMFLMLNQQQNIPELPITNTPTAVLDQSNLSTNPTTQQKKLAKSKQTTKIPKYRYKKQQKKDSSKVFLMSILLLLNIVIVTFAVLFFASPEKENSSQVQVPVDNREENTSPDDTLTTPPDNQQKNELAQQGIIKILQLYENIYPKINIQVGNNIRENKKIISEAMSVLEQHDRKDFYDIRDKVNEIKTEGQTILGVILNHENLLYLLARRIRRPYPLLAQQVFFLSLKECIRKIRNGEGILEDLEDIYFRLGELEKENRPHQDMYYKSAIYTASIIYDHFDYHNMEKDKIREIQDHFREDLEMQKIIQKLLWSARD